GYPFKNSDNLMEVAQFVEELFGSSYVKRAFIERFEAKSEPSADLDELYRVLASLPLRGYLTTNYTDDLTLALKGQGKPPKVLVNGWNDRIESDYDYFKLGELHQSNPVVVHLQGHVTKPDSLVLTQDAFLDFLGRLGQSGRYNPLPDSI